MKALLFSLCLPLLLVSFSDRAEANYCHNDPVNNVDVLGLQAVSVTSQEMSDNLRSRWLLELVVSGLQHPESPAATQTRGYADYFGLTKPFTDADYDRAARLAGGLIVNQGRPSARTPSWQETELAKQPSMMPYVAPPAVQTAALSIGAPSSSAFYADMNAAFLLPIGAEGFVFSGALSGLRIGGIMATGASFERAMLLNGISSELRTGAMLARASGANSSIVWENLVQAGLAAKTPLTPPTTALAKYWPENSGFIGHVDRTHLLPGTVIDRHGYPSGTFVSPFGTPFGARGLPDAYLTSKPYKIYEVLKPIEVNTGQIRPWFYQPGLGIQHELPVSVEILLKRGFLKEVTP